MGLIELLIIAVGVSMDAFAVSVCKGLSVSRIRPVHVFKTALWFGGFQALMPVIGYFVATIFSDLLSSIDHWVSFILLGWIGVNMIRESFSKDTCELDSDFSFRKMCALAVATSIDALAVGVSFAFLKVDIWSAVLLIGVTTAAFSAVGVFLGNILGCRYRARAEMAGGVILILIGLKILLTHLLA